MKKTVFLLSLLVLPVLVCAQTKNTLRDMEQSMVLPQTDHVRVAQRLIVVPLSNMQVIDKVQQVEDYEQFDRYYYEYAKQFLSRDFSRRYLDLLRDYRREAYAVPLSENELFQVRLDFENRQNLLRMEKPLSYRESLVLNEYLSRPTTRENMLAKTQTYQEYDALVYSSVQSLLVTEHAKAYLEQGKVLREEFEKKSENMAAIYAVLRYVLDKSKGRSYLDTMTDGERALIENYLAMPVSVNGQGVAIPLDNYLTKFRKTLPLNQRARYPKVHFEKE